MVAAADAIEVDASRFSDGGSLPDADAVGPGAAGGLRIVLAREVRGEHGAETFRLLRAIAYDDQHRGRIVVPPSAARFETDLTSVPTLFTWLVPKTGAHLPAALIHDGLVGDDRSPTYTTSDGRLVDRVEADRIFRDGMGHLGTGLVRRWLIWTAVTLATIWEARATSSRRWVRQYYRAVMVLTGVAVLVLGYSATADLFDRADRWWLAWQLPWIPEHPFVLELLFGVAGAVVLGAVLGVLWLRFARAGMIAAPAIALLIHVTLALLAVSAVYLGLEWVARRAGARAFVALVAVFVAAMAVLFLVAPAT